MTTKKTKNKPAKASRLLKGDYQMPDYQKVTLEKLTNEELVTYYLNAYTTYCLAGGHSKAYWNKQRCGWYIQILTERNVLEKYIDELTYVDPKGNTQGIFNGDGSY